MGAWGLGPFDNDTAADWAADLDDASSAERPALIREALTAALEADEYLDADDASIAVAAAAVVAALQDGGPALDEGYGPTVGSLHLEPELRGLAARAVARVLGEESEWRELWEEAGQLEDARSELDPILSALGVPTDDADR